MGEFLAAVFGVLWIVGVLAVVIAAPLLKIRFLWNRGGKRK